MQAATTEFLANGSITSVPGFRACGIAAGIKKRGGPDLALIVSDAPCSAAAVFTRNEVKAAPVLFDRATIDRNSSGVRAVVINSGCANAVTGDQGMRNTEQTARVVAAQLALDDHATLVMSTGVIGVQLPMERIEAGIAAAASELADGVEAGHAAARAIMTTDTRPKTVAATIRLGDSTVTIAGMCKGAGMIHPDMATLLALVCTDAAIAPEPLEAALRWAVERSFNCMSIDGDTSTNDTLAVLANGVAAHELITLDSSTFAVFRDALTQVCAELARLVARDGEGASKFVTIEVTGARSFEDARQIGRTIATSPLFKTAIFGTDANWGRVLMAAGRAGVALDPARLALWFGDVQLLQDGAPTNYHEADAHATLLDTDVDVRLDLGLGTESATIWTCDFSHEYVSINADYRT